MREMGFVVHYISLYYFLQMHKNLQLSQITKKIKTVTFSATLFRLSYCFLEVEINCEIHILYFTSNKFRLKEKYAFLKGEKDKLH